MEGRLGVTATNGITELRDTSHQPQNVVLRAAARLVSYVFHPLFVPVYIALLLLIIQPVLFSSFTAGEKLRTIIRFFLLYSFFPLVTVLLAKALGFVQSVYLKTQKERIIPYIACGIYYFWMAYVMRHQAEFAREIVQLSLAIFISSSLGLLANIYMKISMHAISMGILVAFICLLALTQATSYTIYIAGAILLTGLVCTARLIVSDHTQREIYAGLLLGVVSMLLGVWADGILP